jgi:hypothetical protein
LANVGKNYWTFEPMMSLSCLSSKIGLESSAFAGVDVNTKNDDTDNQTGTQFHLDLAVAQHLPLFGGFIPRNRPLIRVDGSTARSISWHDSSLHPQGIRAMRWSGMIFAPL